MISDLSRRLLEYQAEAGACVRCRELRLLHDVPGQRAYPLFQAAPSGAARVLVVGEAPNLTDSFDPSKGRLTYEADTDPTGAFANELLASVGLRIEDVLFTNAVLCLPALRAGKYPVTSRQLDACSSWLARLIEVANPLVVVTFGAKPLAAVGRLQRHHLQLKTAVGQLRPWRGRLLLPLYHPGLLGRATRKRAQQLQDISVLRTFLEEQQAS